jgi:hypothetical protein
LSEVLEEVERALREESGVWWSENEEVESFVEFAGGAKENGVTMCRNHLKERSIVK